MRVVIDVEADALHNPTKVWCIVTKDLDSGVYNVFSEYAETAEALSSFPSYWSKLKLVVGHNVLDWDIPCLRKFGLIPNEVEVIDTLILSRLVDYPRDGHSIEDYGREFNLPKGDHHDFSKYSPELLLYCIRDVDICEKTYRKYFNYLSNKHHMPSIRTEHDFQAISSSLCHNGFAYNKGRGEVLLRDIAGELSNLDEEIKRVFRRKLRLVKEVTPRLTKHETLNRGDFRWLRGTDGNSIQDLSEFNGGPFCRCEWVEFNPNSHRQIIDVLTTARWQPTEKTKTHIQYLRSKSRGSGEEDKGPEFSKYGWRINEQNLATLPKSAPLPARTLAKRIVLESRRRTLTEWNSLVQDDDRIHGQFYGIGAWTHRMAHQKPNTANIPTEAKLYGKEMRSLWQAPKNRLLVGVDADAIQLRIFAHYLDDKEFTNALANGRKDQGTDAHSLNKSILGDSCASRDIAKRYLYALFLGAGRDKLREILGCSNEEADVAFHNLNSRYPGIKTIRERTILRDAKRGWFVGLDGRRVRIPGESPGERKHLAMSGYLQNGEAVIMRTACLKWHADLPKYDSLLVDFVHDEWVTETPNDLEIAETIRDLQCQSIRDVGIELGLKCPLDGQGRIGNNWYKIH